MVGKQHIDEGLGGGLPNSCHGKNTTKPMFILIVDIKDNVDIEVQFDPIKNTSTIMEQCLQDTLVATH